ncbi:MAG: PAS domain S-box protein [Chloroflexi bacterium]|nr:PAS domain S-box protein [Chloroflexota bacterium]
MKQTAASPSLTEGDNGAGQEVLFQNNPLPMWVYDLETYRFLAVNDAAVDQYGYSREEFLSMRITDIRPEEDVPRLLEDLKRERPALQHSGIWRHRRKDGSIIDVEIHSHTLPYHGRPAVLVTALDITERVQAEAALREREEHYRAIFNGVQDAILVETFDGRILAVNDRACEMYGYTREEFLTKTIADLIPPDQPIEISEKETISRPALETYNLRANGERFPVEISGRVQTLGGREILLIIVRDISERKKTEEAIRWQNAYLAALQKTTLELLSQLDLDTLLENIVERAGALVGTDAGFLQLLDPQSGKMIPRVGRGVLAEILHHEVRLGEGVTGVVWQTGQPLLVYDYDHWENRLPSLPKGLISSLAGVPLIFNGEVIGVLALGYEFASHKKLTHADIEILTQFAHLASLAIENATLFSAARRELEERKQVQKPWRRAKRNTVLLSSRFRWSSIWTMRKPSFPSRALSARAFGNLWVTRPRSGWQVTSKSGYAASTPKTVKESSTATLPLCGMVRFLTRNTACSGATGASFGCAIPPLFKPTKTASRFIYRASCKTSRQSRKRKPSCACKAPLSKSSPTPLSSPTERVPFSGLTAPTPA